jgi:hypothetical protein
VKTIHNLGMLLLSLFVFLAGLRGLLSIQYRHYNLIVNLLGVASGVLIFWAVAANWKTKA